MHLTAVDLWTGATFLVLSGTIVFVATLVGRLRRDPTREKLLLAAEQGSRPGGLAEAISHLLPLSGENRSAIQAELVQAGIYRPGALRDFLVLRNGLVAIVLLSSWGAAAALVSQQPQLARWVLVAGLVLGGLCWAVPRMVLRSAARARARRIAAAVPDTLDLMSMCLVGGLSIRETLLHVGRELFRAHPDVAVELVILREQSELLGVDRAFQLLAARTRVPETESLAGLIQQGQQLGTNIAESNSQFSDSLRLRRRQEAELQSGRASVRMLFPLVFCLLPAAAIFLWGPAVVEMVRFLDQTQAELPAQARPISAPRR